MSRPLFDEAFDALLGIEGGYVNDPRDSGGATRWGVTEAVARAYGYAGPMSALPIETARAIYRERYWDAMRLDDVARIAPAVACELFDSAVNCGTATAGRWLQRTLNVLNSGGRHYADIQVDGIVGRLTVAALAELFDRRGDIAQRVLLRALNGLQAAHYIDLAERRPKDEAFAWGWLLNRVA